MLMEVNRSLLVLLKNKYGNYCFDEQLGHLTHSFEGILLIYLPQSYINVRLWQTNTAVRLPNSELQRPSHSSSQYSYSFATAPIIFRLYINET
jgi:hypothetical protein